MSRSVVETPPFTVWVLSGPAVFRLSSCGTRFGRKKKKSMYCGGHGYWLTFQASTKPRGKATSCIGRPNGRTKPQEAGVRVHAPRCRENATQTWSLRRANEAARRHGTCTYVDSARVYILHKHGTTNTTAVSSWWNAQKWQGRERAGLHVLFRAHASSYCRTGASSHASNKPVRGIRRPFLGGRRGVSRAGVS